MILAARDNRSTVCLILSSFLPSSSPCTTNALFTCEETVCPLECAALMSSDRTHRTTVVSCRENHLLSSSPNTILYPHFGQGTGKKRASDRYSTRTQSSNLHFSQHNAQRTTKSTSPPSLLRCRPLCPATTITCEQNGVSAQVHSTYVLHKGCLALKNPCFCPSVCLFMVL
jgi:hypothetical protein